MLDQLGALKCAGMFPRARILSASVGIGCDRTASASLSISLRQPRRSTQCLSESRKRAATRIGENHLQGALARLALPFDRLAQAAEVDLRRRRYQASDDHGREYIPIAGLAELPHQPSRFAVDRLERRRWDLPSEQRTDYPQT